MSYRSFILPARARAWRLLFAGLGILIGAGCSSPVDSDTCAPLGGTVIDLRVVDAATGESLTDVAYARVTPVDPPREGAEGLLSASTPENPLRVAVLRGVYLIVVEAPGYERAHTEVTVRGACEIETEKVVIRMEAS